MRMSDTIVLSMRVFQIKLLNSFKVYIVESCEAPKELFDVEGLNADEGHVVMALQFNELHLIKLPRLKHVWIDNPQGVMGFKNLILLKIHDCNSLTNVVSLSMSLGLVQLPSMNRCSLIEEIVIKEEEHALLDKINTISI
ncbi:uncharacterized protein LOC105631626 [Jatropha curcas]|uniref:uncharacterized protein LOC105631626 n=1 Tax=Jatropha curcas TaxID=180498 RepID=UPI0005FB3F99|nr:uncharacterized protein LOC105631626 [Jatropha curcas]